jgi:ssDNA-specific exonuclease RecJ
MVEDKINVDKLYKKINNKYNISKTMFENIIKIYSEIKVVKNNNNEIIINNVKMANELDLSNSVYYNNIIKIKEDQKKLNKLLSDKNLFNFIKNLTNLKEENNEF